MTLTSLGPMEAALAVAKLESEGIACFAANREVASVQWHLGVPVQVQVRRCDLERAKAVLEARQEAADDEYVEEEWRCPKCRRKTLDLLPPTAAQRRRRNLWLVLLAAGIIWMWLPVNAMAPVPREVQWGVALAWVAGVLVLGALVLPAKRGKRCRECGWMKKA